ncbi:MAG: cytochrome C [Calditrichaeota bacterium]|nr:MAG: cytochrome C [Calditrichota bacterium]
MAQIFHPSTNTFSKVTIFGAVFFLFGFLWLFLTVERSSYVTQAGVVREQPVPFSHRHHVSQLGLDCRYCHTSVEESSFAGIPPTKTCMTCHSQIHATAKMLEPVRESWRTGKPLQWTRVHDLPDFVYFNHSIHVNKGVACETCHGPIGKMTLVWKENSLNMEWCLGCHRHPEKYVRPREFVFTTGWKPEVDQTRLGEKLVADYKIQKLTNCSICHR